MVASISHVLKTNVVALGIDPLATDEARAAFVEAVQSEVVPQLVAFAAPSGGPPIQGQALQLAQDRITVESSQLRFVVEREYPEKESLDRIAELAGMAFSYPDLNGTDTANFGFNVELVFDQDSGDTALEYLAKRIFSNNPNIPGWELAGGAGKMVFLEGGNQWNVTIEPRFNDANTSKVFCSINLHLGERPIPDREELLNCLALTWDHTMQFVEAIDANADN
ncbi:MAG: hypothetical protein OXK81_14190 [Chloroflexota bacterium]|nr:hypothetical protein [Chloroflexota bacterium]